MTPLEVLLIFFLPILIFSGLLVWGIRRAIRFQNVMLARLAIVEAEEKPVLILKFGPQHYQIKSIDQPPMKWQSAIIAVTATHIILYNRDWKVEERLRLSLDDLRWFGRPEKYSNGNNEIWLHFEGIDNWSILKFKLSREYMQDFVRALKAVVPPELVTAYRRRRPYIHISAQAVQPAVQDIHGAWTLNQPVDLYLMPRFLIILRDGKVLRKLALESVQQISALHRLDQPSAQGLVRFRAEEETFAFAHPQHEHFAKLLAEAAKRTLETPLERKQKNKLDDDYDYDYDYDESDFVLEENYDA
jgi:hypothetical protein